VLDALTPTEPMDEDLPARDPISVRLSRPVEPAGDDFARGIAYETIRQRLFGHHQSSTIGRYQVKKLIGRGGMGEVYAAYDPELDRHVAIKRVGRRTSDDDDEARRLRDALIRDARSAARVQHPHVVEVYDCGVESEELYVVMELVEGPTLEQWLSGRPRSWRAIVEIFIQVGLGLGAAHAHGIVHRDFKPNNVLVGPDGRARVADFGLARLADELRVTRPEGERISLPGTHDGAGTPQYMAPEQYRGTEVGPRADQFAYCNALYRALFREVPFEGRTLEELASNVVGGHLRPPASRHGAPRTLVRLVLRGLAADPECRHASMDELVARLRSVLLQRRRVAWFSGVLVVAASTALVGYSWPREAPSPCTALEEPWTADERRGVHEALLLRSPLEHHTVDQTMARLDEHARAWQLARQDACEATQIRGEQSDETMDLRLACLARHRVPFSSVWSRLAASDGPTGMEALALVRQLAPASECNAELVREQAKLAQAFRARTDRSASPESEGEWTELSAQLTNARAEAAMGRHARAHRLAVGVAEIAEPRGYRYLLADALLLEGVYGLRLARTEQQLERAAQALERAAPLAIASGSDRLAAVVFLELAAARSGWRTPENPHMWLDLAAAHAGASPTPQDLEVRIEIARGDLFTHAERFAEATRCYRRALELGEGDPEAVRAAHGLAEAQRRSGDLQGAKQTWQQLREELERRGWSEPSSNAAILHNLALVAIDEQALDEALALARAAERAYEASASSDDLPLQLARITVARVLRHRGELQSVPRILDGVVQALEHRRAAAHVPLVQALDERVEAALGLGDPESATRASERLLELALSRYTDGHAEVARARMMLAKAALAAGDVERARSESARAHAAMRDAPPGLLRAEVAFRHAEAQLAAGDREAARRLVQDATGMLAELPGAAFARQEVQSWAEERGLADGE
jgi:tRNA A-37 threonylcarbamoyl transferase component Bud32/tetratricopeptide (TPR) repeat protein